MSSRRLQQIIRSVATSDGAGVSLRRSLGQSPSTRVDPFLMLDEFSSDDPDDYIAGFPSHPHRGFETVTYMLDGHMLHEDHLGNRGDLLPGGAQWMTAGPVQGLATEPLYIDVHLPAGGRFAQAVTPGHSAFVYAYEGDLAIGPADDARPLRAQDAGVLSAGERVEISAAAGPARFLLLAARPLGEPVVQHGPFVMNSREEIDQAIADYRHNRLV